jgi:putative phage-type endonuclease
MGARVGVRKLRAKKGSAAAVTGSLKIVMDQVSSPTVRDDLEQNTEEWHAWRDQHINGSDAPIIMLADSYGDPYRLWQEKTGRAPRRELRDYYEGDELIEHPAHRGHRLEDVARQWYCQDRGVFTAPVCLEHHSIGWMGCSLDGWPDRSLIVEIKCPRELRTHLNAREGNVSESHWIQCQHNMSVANAQFCDYVSFWTEASAEAPDVCVVRIARDEQFISAELLPAEQEFRLWVERDEFPLPQGEIEIDPTDEVWQATVTRYLAARRAREEAERVEGAAIRDLKLRTRGAARTRFGPIECKWFVRRGWVKWQEIPEVQEIASRLGRRLDAYRGASTLAFRVNRHSL